MIGRFIAILLISHLSHPLAFAIGEVRYGKVESFLQSQGISEYFTAIGLDAEVEYLSVLKKNAEEKMKDERTRDDAEENLQFIEYAIRLTHKLKEIDDKNLAAELYLRVKRVIYGVISGDYRGESFPVGYYMKEVVEGLFVSFPYMKNEIAKKTKSPSVEKEASFLVDPRTNEYVSLEQMKMMSVKQIAELDVPTDHPNWRQHQSMEGVDPWKEIEAFHQKYVTKTLVKKFPEIFDDKFKYDLQDARKVLFFDEIKIKDTNPKINLRDRFGVKWKMKWGAEVQSEPVANSLYLLSGAKMADLVYTNSPEAGFIVVFPKTSKTVENNEENQLDCEKIATIQRLSTCLLQGIYKFDVTPYIEKSGVLTTENIGSLLGEESKSLPEYSYQMLLGSEFVVFNEALLEFRGSKGLENGGYIPTHNMGSELDRASRGNALFSFWIHNVDGSDLNTRSYLAKVPGEDEWAYLEGQQDIGTSIGSILLPAHVNRMKLGHQFMHAGEKRIFPNEFILHRPSAWDHATHADMLWMAKHLDRIDRKKIDQVVARTNWPDFMQVVLVRKLESRLKTILFYYGLSSKSGDDLKKLNVEIDLSTPEKREKVATKYQIPVAEINRLLGLRDASGKIDYIDNVVNTGKIASCRSSLVVNLLEKYRYPSGLSRRVVRYADDRPLPACRWHY